MKHKIKFDAHEGHDGWCIWLYPDFDSNTMTNYTIVYFY